MTPIPWFRHRAKGGQRCTLLVEELSNCSILFLLISLKWYLVNLTLHIITLSRCRIEINSTYVIRVHGVSVGLATPTRLQSECRVSRRKAWTARAARSARFMVSQLTSNTCPWPAPATGATTRTIRTSTTPPWSPTPATTAAAAKATKVTTASTVTWGRRAAAVRRMKMAARQWAAESRRTKVMPSESLLCRERPLLVLPSFNSLFFHALSPFFFQTFLFWGYWFISLLFFIAHSFLNLFLTDSFPFWSLVLYSLICVWFFFCFLFFIFVYLSCSSFPSLRSLSFFPFVCVCVTWVYVGVDAREAKPSWPLTLPTARHQLPVATLWAPFNCALSHDSVCVGGWAPSSHVVTSSNQSYLPVINFFVFLFVKSDTDISVNTVTCLQRAYIFLSVSRYHPLLSM